MEIRFGIQSAEHRTIPSSAQKMVNCYLEANVPGSRSQVDIIPAYGVTEFNDITFPQGANYIADTLYVIGENGLYTINSAGLETLKVAFNNTGYAQIEGEKDNLVILDGSNKLYGFDGTTLTALSASLDFSWLGFIDRYWVAIRKDTGAFYINETAGDFSTWNTLDFAVASSNPDFLRWGIVDKRELILFGDQSTQIYYNSGDADFPFSVVPNGTIETGIFSKRAAGKIGNAVFFLGHDGIAYQLAGYTPQRISNHAFEQAIEGYTKSCKLMVWHESGHAMVGFKFPEGFWVYDLSTQLWHNRKTYNKDTWDVEFIQFAYRNYYTGGSTLGRLDADVFTDLGDIMRLQCTSTNISDKMNLINHDRLELIFETGQGDAEVMLRFSDDGGLTWSNEIWEGMGAIGNYRDRVLFHQLGSSRDRVYEYSITDNYRRTLMQATLNEWN
jgi:hypothetical protein